MTQYFDPGTHPDRALMADLHRRVERDGSRKLALAVLVAPDGELTIVSALEQSTLRALVVDIARIVHVQAPNEDTHLDLSRDGDVS